MHFYTNDTDTERYLDIVITFHHEYSVNIAPLQRELTQRKNNNLYNIILQVYF